MGKTLLISGATGGLGSLVAHELAGTFPEVILMGRNNAALGALSSELKGAVVHIALADISRFSQVEDALSQFDRIDGMVNAAAILGPVEKFGDEKWNEWEETIAINLIGNAAVCRAALPKLLRAKRGKIVNFSGGGAAGARQHHSAYAASKAAMVRLTEIIAKEYPTIDANAIAPGAHNTGIWRGETYDSPPKKWADAKRFVSLVSFLLSEKSDGISGKFLHIYDKWEELTPRISQDDMYSLRRIEPKPGQRR